MKDAVAPSVLIVDDDNDIRDVVVETLSDEGYGARGAANGEEALDLLRSEPALPRVILLDMMMPVMDGATFRAAQLDDPDLRAIPVVVMSASAHIEEAASRLGATAFLRKPVELVDLFAIAERFCRR